MASAVPSPKVTTFIPAYENISKPLASNHSALTTVFTPAASCQSDLYELDSTWSAAWQISGCHASKYITTYSPGLCYSGYEPAVSFKNIVSHQTETVVECCPSGMSFDAALGCALSINPAMTVMSPSPMIVDPTSITTLTKTLKHARTVAVVGLPTEYEVTSTETIALTAGNVFAPAVQIRFQESDSAIANTWSSIFAAYASASISRASTTPRLAEPPLVTGQSSTTSSSTVAAIVLGAVLGMLLLGAMILLCLRRRHRSAREVHMHEKEAEPSIEQPMIRVEDDRQVEARSEAHEMQAPIPMELPTYIAGQPRSVSSRAGVVSRAGVTSQGGHELRGPSKLAVTNGNDDDHEAVSPCE